MNNVQLLPIVHFAIPPNQINKNKDNCYHQYHPLTRHHPKPRKISWWNSLMLVGALAISHTAYCVARVSLSFSQRLRRRTLDRCCGASPRDESSAAECRKPSMRFGMLSLPQVHASYLFIVRTKPPDTHRDRRSAGRNAPLKESDAQSDV